jgi:hypothetical protein
MYRSLAAAALIGAAVAYGFRPTKTKVNKLSLLGPKTGATYQVEDFVDAGFVIIKAADGSTAVFQRAGASPIMATGSKGFVWQHGKGRPETLRAIYLDVVGEPPPPSAVGPKAVPNPVAGETVGQGRPAPKPAPAPPSPKTAQKTARPNRTTP